MNGPSYSISSFNVRNKGAVGNNVIDDTPALQALLNTAATPGLGLDIRFPSGTFYCARNLHITRTGMLSGLAGALGGNSATVIRFAAGKGMIVHGPTTSPCAGGHGTQVEIQNFEFIGETLKLGAWAPFTVQAVGATTADVNANRYYYECIEEGTTGKAIPTFVGCYIPDSSEVWTAGTSAVAGSTVRKTGPVGSAYFECTTSGVTDKVEPTWDTTPGATTQDGSAVWTARDAAGLWITDGTVVWACKVGAGIWLRTRANIHDNRFYRFTNAGIHVQAASTNYYPPTNANGFRIHHNRIVQCGVGIAVRGLESNAGTITENDIEAAGYLWKGTGGVGVWDGSFLGCWQYANQAAACTGPAYIVGRYDVLGGLNARGGTLRDCYSEADCQPSIVVGANALVDGGNHGAGFSPETSAIMIGVGGCRNITESDDSSRKKVLATLNWQGRSTVHAYCSLVDDPTVQIGQKYEAATLGRPGWWSTAFGPYASGRSFSASKAAEGYGWDWCPLGEFKGGQPGDKFAGQYFVGYDVSAMTSSRIRRYGLFKAGDRFELTRGTCAVKTEGYRAPKWKANTDYQSTPYGAGTGDGGPYSCVEPVGNLTPIPVPGSCVYICSASGRSGAIEPTWPSSPGSWVKDGTVIWTLLGTVAEYTEWRPL